MKNIYLLIITIIFLNGCLLHEAIYNSSSTNLPDTEYFMNTSGFWISKCDYPDKIIMTQNQIKIFNNSIKEKEPSVKDISNFTEKYSGKKLIDQINDMFKYIQTQKLYFANGRKTDKKFYQEILKNAALNNIKDEIDVKFGFIIHFCNQRVLPSNELLNDVPRELFFDSLQMSLLNFTTPVAILHKTLDGNWYFVHGPITDGWVEAKNIIFCKKEDIFNFINKDKFAVVVKNKCDVFLNEKMTLYYDFLRMGVKIPLSRYANFDIVEIIIPSTDEQGNYIEKKGYISKRSINEGYLDYTQRNVLIQAFDLLYSPYGWGGMFGEQDCSGILCEIFSTVGIILPRNGKWQINACKIEGEFDEKSSLCEEKLEILKDKGIPGATLLKSNNPGHIMLYLGFYHEKPYIIHSTWAYKEKINFKDTVRLINKVTVSGLYLGENTKNGSILKRITKISNVILE